MCPLVRIMQISLSVHFSCFKRSSVHFLTSPIQSSSLSPDTVWVSAFFPWNLNYCWYFSILRKLHFWIWKNGGCIWWTFINLFRKFFVKSTAKLFVSTLAPISLDFSENDSTNLILVSHVHKEWSVLSIFIVHTSCTSVNEHQVASGCIFDVQDLWVVKSGTIVFKLLVQVDRYPHELFCTGKPVKTRIFQIKLIKMFNFMDLLNRIYSLNYSEQFMLNKFRYVKVYKLCFFHLNTDHSYLLLDMILLQKSLCPACSAANSSTNQWLCLFASKSCFQSLLSGVTNWTLLFMSMFRKKSLYISSSWL